MRKLLEKTYKKAVLLNHKNILGLLEKNKEARFIDLGCNDGEMTLKFAKKINTKKNYGIDIVDEKIEMATKKGIIVKKNDLNKNLDFGDNFFDVVHANQVIEHLYDSDNFLSEIYRILKQNGYAIISTENASSWCNIFSSIMGWQIFSLTNFSKKKGGIGNPFSLQKECKSCSGPWIHNRVYNIKGLKEYFEILGFKIEKIKGAGYFPFPAVLGNIDKIHCHFMTFKIRK